MILHCVLCYRKTLDKLNQYERQLIKDIDSGDFAELLISKKESKDGKEVIYYKISSETV